eukprot:CAMPEP_0175301920 /NCGR_PEP_ID=MMETSP0093-20121207/61899_1 /TAXON_ID=311494 /ORGANISM="Alexandrium monilatum, Strain CCMP3105" /LENGTH=46 /DNA_ID= /DNA_START= /DNA_END= /DNA_ORIENTATION=
MPSASGPLQRLRFFLGYLLEACLELPAASLLHRVLLAQRPHNEHAR